MQGRSAEPFRRAASENRTTVSRNDARDLEFDTELTGLSLAGIDLIIDETGDADPDGKDAADDLVPVSSGTSVTRTGDIWWLGRHRLLRGDTRSVTNMDRLMAGELADLVFTDPPCVVARHGCDTTVQGGVTPADRIAYMEPSRCSEAPA